MNHIAITRTACLAWFLVGTLFVGSVATADVLPWSGAGTGNDWANAENWEFYNIVPGPDDTVYFSNTGSSTLPDTVTNSIVADRTIGGMAYDNSSRYHTTDLGGNTLTVEGDLNFNTNQSGHTTTIIRNGNLLVTDPLGYINVGRSESSTAWANVNLSTLDSFNADVHELRVGSKLSGTATGELALAVANDIEADRIVLGDGGTANVRLGDTNRIVADEMLIGGSYSNALVEAAAGGTVQLGDAARRTSLTIGKGITNTNSTYTATLDLSSATLDAHLDHLTVGQKDNMPGGQRGNFYGGDGGSVTVGAPGNTSNMIVGEDATGVVDFAAMDSFTASLDQLIVGRSGGGTVTLPTNVTIDAREISVATNSGATLSLGLSNTILVDEMLVGGSYGNGTVDVRPGGITMLGSPHRPTTLTVGKGITNTNSTYTGTLDFRGASLNAHLDHLVVGQKDSNPGNQRGYFYGGDSGMISIGQPGSPANMIVGDRATGVADFSSMQVFTANLDEMLIGQSKSGTVNLAATSSIDARRILVGSGASATLALGLDNTILADELEIGGSYANGTVTIRSGGTLRLGSADRRTTLTIGKGTTNTNSTYSGTFDLTGATLIALLDHVIVAEKDTNPGVQKATFTISDLAGNDVDANSIVIGGTKSTGTMNFGGGRLAAGSIERGAGTANFNWTGGELSVGAFGAPQRSFDLDNDGDGTLAPGRSVGLTEVFGDYTQGDHAAMAVEIASLAEFDQLLVHDDITLDGALLVEFLAGPVIGEFPIVAYDRLFGEFNEIVIPDLSPGDYSIDYGSGTNDVITLTSTVPEPSTFVLAAIGLMGLLFRAKRRSGRPL
ncbi:MAG: PEP-CTERM sorting domain-containing protein [Candidatus Nealsonbacteria bacterium]|nr:PEP-CTERM sorting domain-containing protein [Candidatus Nealsonbacteria bacterium]